jgi:DNA-binding NarL/FixJ family response regulator
MEARDRPVRVLLANKPRALRTRLARLLRLQSDIEVAGTVLDPIDLLSAVGETQAAVVVVTLPASGEMPGICSHLFYEYPQLLILALSATQSRAYVYHHVITVEPLASTSDEAILTAVRQAKADRLS